MTSIEILEALNTYDGINIWDDVILCIPGYDEEATDLIDVGYSDRFIADGIEYRHAHEIDRWII